MCIRDRARREVEKVALALIGKQLDAKAWKQPARVFAVIEELARLAAVATPVGNHVDHAEARFLPLIGLQHALHDDGQRRARSLRHRGCGSEQGLQCSGWRIHGSVYPACPPCACCASVRAAGPRAHNASRRAPCAATAHAPRGNGATGELLRLRLESTGHCGLSLIHI